MGLYARFGGIPIILAPHMFDGELMYVEKHQLLLRPPKYFMLGTMPLTNEEWCRREALRIVHSGLSDVLEWLGEKPYVPPKPHNEFLASLRR